MPAAADLRTNGTSDVSVSSDVRRTADRAVRSGGEITRNQAPLHSTASAAPAIQDDATPPLAAEDGWGPG